MVSGFPPFTDPDGNEMKTFANIIKGELTFPSDVPFTKQARELLGGFLQVKLSVRLGYLKGGAEDVISHAWFSSFDWAGLVNLTVEVPWRPRLKAADDVRFFGNDVEKEFCEQAASSDQVRPRPA